MTVAELARRSGSSAQNIDDILTSAETRTTRQSRRASFAKALGVSVYMLSGDAVFLPSGARVGYEFRYSARTWLATGALIEKCTAAVRRDLRELPERLQRDQKTLAVLNTVLWSVKKLIEVGRWREQLLRFTPPRHARQGYLEPLSSNIEDVSAPPVDDPEHEGCVVALANALEHILSPWFEGKAKLDYATLGAMGMEDLTPHTHKREGPLTIMEGVWDDKPGTNNAR